MTTVVPDGADVEGPIVRSYLAILRLPGALAFCATGFLIRLGGSMSTIATILMVSSLYGSYGLAGALVAASSASWAVGSAFLAHLADRFGQRRVMLPSVLVSSGLLLLLVVLAWRHVPAWVLFIPQILCGFTSISIPAVIKARWAFVTQGLDQFQSALSLESTLDEITYVVGPLLATAISLGVAPVAAPAAVALTSMAGALLLHLQRRTEPEPGFGRQESGEKASGFLPAIPGTALVIASIAVIAIGLGGVSVTMTAATEAWGVPGTVGIALGLMSLGSACGGFAYGARHWTSPLARRYLVIALILAAGVSAYLLAGGPVTLSACAFVAGAAMAPTMINANALMRGLVPAARLTEGLAWVGTSVGLGFAAGAALAGQLIDRSGYRAGFWMIVTAVWVGALVVLGSVRVLSARLAARAESG
ncbi:MAG: hypothetical protein LBR33_12400 [Propionibacteriaceae bacterium]|jgi:MFS family permease|nr:hypothetical protein [Propionibacteriaceae bacterium]